jgi:beta-mannosidase
MTDFDAGRQIISLNGDDWRLAQAPAGETRLLPGLEPVLPGPAPWPGRATAGGPRQGSEAEGWLPATVPGDVHLDLIHAGRLPDPHFGQNSLAGHWVDAHDWWLVRDLADLDLSPDRRVFLRLRGVDYLSEVYFNGHHLDRHEGMFSPQLYEVTGMLTGAPRGGEATAGTLAVRVTGTAHLPPLRGERVGWLTRRRDRQELRVGLSQRWPHRRSVLKCQMGFGWDFAPDLPSLGIWDDVELIVTGDVFIRDLLANPTFSEDLEGPVRLQVTLELDARAHSEVEIGLNLYGLNCDAPPLVQLFPATLQPGRQRLACSLDVPEPHLWWPWERGAPNLYRLIVNVRRHADVLDRVNQTLGLRQIRLEPNPDVSPQPPERSEEGEILPWVFVVNGQRLFLRGANWVPASLFPGQVTAKDYQALLDLARQANMNALRVWGGGLREKAAFYDCCDRLGLLVWQEFPFACAFLTRYPRSDDYLALVAQEARAIVRELRHHPSVTLWCGGNEFDPARNRPLVETLAAAVAAEDPTRPFVPTSPTGGDRHNWHVWHGHAPASVYREDRSQFASEFGLQAPPVAETLRQFIPPDELWPPGPSWAHHNADWPKLRRYAAPLLDGRKAPRKVALEEFLAASQRAQALGLQVAIEHHRRRKYACGGCLLWQFNTPWPAIEWAILDYYRRPKPAYDVVQRLYAPVLVSLEYPLVAYKAGSQFCPSVWVINDRAEPLPGCRLEITLENADGTPLEWLERTLDLSADSAEVVARFCWTLPAGARWARCRLSQGDTLLSFNEYDLSFHDPGRPARWRRFLSWLGDRLLGRGL